MALSYQQPTKKFVRERVLTKAIRTLTTDRLRSTVVRTDELEETVEYAAQQFRNVRFTREINTELRLWREGYSSHVGAKKPRDLQVLYLCGPEPLNDLDVLLENGVVPQNVWAVESIRENLGLAARALAASFPQVRLHPGDLDDLLRVYPGRFDIVYYDACGSLFRDDVLNPILTLFKEAKLQPLSVLITNFATVPPKYRTEYVPVLSSYFRYRYNDLPKTFWSAKHRDPEMCQHDDSDLQTYVEKSFEPFYSDFITRFINDLARYWIPNCRALALQAVSDNYLIESEVLRKYLKKAQSAPDSASSIEEWLDQVGDMALSPSSYPILSFYEDLKERKPAFAAKIAALEIGGRRIEKLLAPACMLDKVFEGHWQAISRDMLKAIAFSWFDSKQPFSCDSPLPNLIVNSLLGIYGHPYFANCRRGDRLSYTAKRTKMFTDVFVLDQCRYYYDWFPTLLLAPFRFQSRAFQVVARCILDRIGRTDHESSSHPFRGAAVAAFGAIPSAKPFNLGAREDLATNSQ